jgi:hypothetical protein
MTNTNQHSSNFQHSVECNTSRQFGWTYWTDISNWNDPPARFELDGRLRLGHTLTTMLPDRTYHSIIRHVEPGRAATIEMQLPDGVLSSHWDFEDLTENRTRLTQRLVLSATDAALVYSGEVAGADRTCRDE